MGRLLVAVQNGSTENRRTWPPGEGRASPITDAAYGQSLPINSGQSLVSCTAEDRGRPSGPTVEWHHLFARSTRGFTASKSSSDESTRGATRTPRVLLWPHRVMNDWLIVCRRKFVQSGCAGLCLCSAVAEGADTATAAKWAARRSGRTKPNVVRTDYSRS